MFSQTHSCPKKLIRTQMPSRCVFCKNASHSGNTQSFMAPRTVQGNFAIYHYIFVQNSLVCHNQFLSDWSGQVRAISCSTHGRNNQGINLVSALNFIFISSHCKASGVHLEKKAHHVTASLL